MKPKQLLRRFASGSFHNVSFSDFLRLVEACGFAWVRTSGSHRVYTHSSIPGLLNLQEVAGEPKPYQVRQFLRLIERYNIRLEGEDV